MPPLQLFHLDPQPFKIHHLYFLTRGNLFIAEGIPVLTQHEDLPFRIDLRLSPPLFADQPFTSGYGLSPVSPYG